MPSSVMDTFKAELVGQIADFERAKTGLQNMRNLPVSPEFTADVAEALDVYSQILEKAQMTLQGIESLEELQYPKPAIDGLVDRIKLAFQTYVDKLLADLRRLLGIHEADHVSIFADPEKPIR